MKQCITCKQQKSLTEYHKNKRKSDGLQNECKECCKIRDRKYYKKYGSKAYVTRHKTYKKRNKLFIEKYKKIYGKCVDCGITDYRVLQFDHIKNKSANVSDLLDGSSLQVIKEEVRKCEMRCANCHQIKTHYT